MALDVGGCPQVVPECSSREPSRAQHPFDLHEVHKLIIVKDHSQIEVPTERVDTPDNALHKDFVLIQSNQRTYQTTTLAPRL